MTDYEFLLLLRRKMKENGIPTGELSSLIKAEKMLSRAKKTHKRKRVKDVSDQISSISCGLDASFDEITDYDLSGIVVHKD